MTAAPKPPAAPPADPVPGTHDAADAHLDARGLLCPLPVLKARKRLQPLAHGAVLEALTDDPAAVVDIPHFCAEQGHAVLLDAPLDGGGRRWRIRKGG